MKLTQKDAEFIERLRRLMDEKDVSVELHPRPVTHMLLRRNYGAKIQAVFGMTRQGVRWRFNRVFNEVYVQAYCTILWIESRFGTELRQMALEVARDRAEMRRRALESTGQSAGVRNLGQHKD